MKIIWVAAAVLAGFIGTTANAQSKYSKDADTHYKNQQRAADAKRQQDNRSVANNAQQQRNTARPAYKAPSNTSGYNKR